MSCWVLKAQLSNMPLWEVYIYLDVTVDYCNLQSVVLLVSSAEGGEEGVLWVEPSLPVLSLILHLCLFLLLLLFHSFIGGANRVRRCSVVSSCRHYTQEISTSPAIYQGIHKSLRWYKYCLLKRYYYYQHFFINFILASKIRVMYIAFSPL